MVAVALMLLSPGCVSKVTLQVEDVSDHLWLQLTHNGEALDGFYVSPDGRLQLVNSQHVTGVSWELSDNRLLLQLNAAGQLILQPTEYFPFLSEGQLVLSPSSREGRPVYSAVSIQGPLNNVLYYYNHPAAFYPASPNEIKSAYIQFDNLDNSLRGYGGINNFYGHYQRTGKTGFKVRTLHSTRMSGPAIDDEIKLIQCLERADSFLSFRKELFFYQGSSSLCSFRAH